MHKILASKRGVTVNESSLKNSNSVNQTELGKHSDYDSTYNPSRLFAIPREDKRDEIGIDSKELPFYGYDCWNHYEVSWLNPKGKPMVAIVELFYECTTPNIIESKSLKLYFNSFNNTQFNSMTEIEQTVKNDLAERVGGDVEVIVYPLNHPKYNTVHHSFSGECLDDLDIECSDYIVDSSFLTVSDESVSEVLYSDLLKSNCLVTNQPDWGSVQIEYEGKKIDREGLLKYLISFRNHNEFHEQCIERIFIDILRLCKPERLTVYGRYTRRGGLDINPYRSTEKPVKRMNIRLVRQ